MKIYKPFFLGLAVLSIATLVPFSKSTAQEKRPILQSRSGSKLPDATKRPLPSGAMKIPFLKPVSNSMTETPAVMDCLPEDVLEGDLSITTVEEWKASLDVCSVGGNLVVEGLNLSFVFFSKLRRVGGYLHVNNNPELEWIFLPLLKEVKGDIVFTHNFKLGIGDAEIGPNNIEGCKAFDKQNANVDLGSLQSFASLIIMDNTTGWQLVSGGSEGTSPKYPFDSLGCGPEGVITEVQAHVGSDYVEGLKLRCQSLNKGSASYSVTSKHWDSDWDSIITSNPKTKGAISDASVDASIPEGNVLTKLWYKTCEKNLICELEVGSKKLSKGMLLGETEGAEKEEPSGKFQNEFLLDCGKKNMVITSMTTAIGYPGKGNQKPTLAEPVQVECGKIE